MESPSGARGRIDNYQVVQEATHHKACSAYLVWDVSRACSALLKLAHAAGGPSSVAVLHETWILGRLRHPGIPALVDFGLAADGRPWFASAPVRTKTIARVEHGMLPANEVAQMICDIAEILDHAHAHGVIARRLSPDTIALRDDEEGTPATITDWSDAQVCGQHAPMFSADVACLAPELLSGAAADQRADIYALGAVAYWALTGVAPSASAAFASLAGRMLQSGYTSAAERCPGAPARLTVLIDQMLSTDPRHRPASCVEVRDIAAQILDEEQREAAAESEIAESSRKRWLDAEQLATEPELASEMVTPTDNFASV